MSAKINLFNDLVTGSATAVEPKEGYVYVVTKISFKNESDSPGNVRAGVPGRENTCDAVVQAGRETGWEGTFVLEYGENLIVAASPAVSVRCTVEGYFLLDVPAFARKGAGALDEAYTKSGAIQVMDSYLAKVTYLMLVELKRIRMTLDSNATEASDRGLAVEEIERELEL